MDLLECLEFLRSNGIDVADTSPLAGVPKRFPVVLKVNTTAHKTEKNLVRIVHCAGDFSKEYKSLKKKGPVLVQEMFEGIELILGIQNDETFGKVVMVGAGGTFTEILKDVAFRAVPLTNSDAKDMVSELRIFEALKGFRGRKYCLEALERTIVCLSKIAEKHEIKSLDINPFLLNEKRGVAVDCRIF